MRAELTKIRTRPATWIALAVALTADTGLGVLAATDVVRVAGRDGPVAIGQLGGITLAPAYVLIAIAVFAAGGEFPDGQIRLSLLAVPRRGRLFAAKSSVSALVTVLAAVVALLPGHLVRRAGWADLLVLVVAYLLLALIGFGLAVITRTVVAPLALLSVAAVLVAPTLRGPFPALVRHLPHDAARSLVGMPADPAALGRAGGLLMLTAWAVVLLAGAGWAFVRRDN
jgi:ABC-2 type transport system permease protein